MQLRRLKPSRAHLRVATLAILIAMCTLLILSTVFPFPEGTWDFLSIGTSQKAQANPGWLSIWNYRVAINLTGQSGAGTNYQVQLSVGNTSGGDFDVNGHCTDFPNDIMFTDNDETTELDYFCEDTTADPATFWVEVTDDLSSGTVTIYCYYGKDGQSSSSDGDATFLVFDHFDDTSLDASTWTEWLTSGSYSETGTELHVQGGASWEAIGCKSQYSAPVAFEYYAKFDEQASILFGADQRSDGGGGNVDALTFYYSSSKQYKSYNDGSSTATSRTPDCSSYRRLSITFVSGSAKYYIDDALGDTHTTNLPNENIGLSFACSGATTDIYIDWAATRKFCTPEPGFDSAGSEEEPELAWPSGYEYRKELSINGTSGAGINYQVEFLIGETSGATGEDFDLEGHCTDFPNDITFTDSVVGSELDYWVEGITGTSPNQTATVWVEVSANLDTDQTIYCYYGKSGQTSSSDGDATFLAFDDMDSYNPTSYIGSVGDKFSGHSDLVQLSNGNLITCQTSGTTQKAYYSTDDGETWAYLSTVHSSSGEAAITTNGTSIWAIVDNGTNFVCKESDDGGSTWGSENTIVSRTNRRNVSIAYVAEDLLLASCVDIAGGVYDIEVYNSTNGGTTWGYVTDAITDQAISIEHPHLFKHSDGTILAGYEKEVSEEGQGDLYCVRSSSNGTSWGVEVTIYHPANYDNEDGCFFENDTDDLWYIWTTDEDSAGGSYRKAIVKCMKSADSGATWGNKTTLYDSKDKVRISGAVKIGSDVRIVFQEHSSNDAARRLGTVLVPTLFTDWAQVQGSIHCEEDSGESVLAVDGYYYGSADSFATIGATLTNYAIDTKVRPHNSDEQAQIIHRFEDTDDYYVWVIKGAANNTISLITYESGSDIVLDSDSFTVSDTWYDLSLRMSTAGSNLEAESYIDDVLYNDYTENPITHASGKAGISANYILTAYPGLFDDFRTRKYVSPEPVFNLEASEETYMEITNTPDSNDYGVVEVDTTSSTAIDYFTITNTGTVSVDITIHGTDMTGGDDTWTLSDTATAGENQYGLRAGLDDDDDSFDVIVRKTETYNTLVGDLGANTTQDWGLQLIMPSSLSGYDSQQMTATITLVASEA